MNPLFDPLIKAHISQDYGSFQQEIPFDDLITKYALFPNEAIYLVDCISAQMEPLTENFSQIVGIDSNYKNELTVLYEHVHSCNIDAFLKYTQRVVKCGFDKSCNLSEEKDFVMSVYLSHHHRVILKTTTILYYDSNQTMRYTIGKLTDVTDLIPFQHFSYKFTGPNSATLYNLYEQNSEGDCILGKREIEILRLIGKRMSSQAIANSLYISKHTVDKHRRNIIGKLDCKNSSEAYIRAKNLGLI